MARSRGYRSKKGDALSSRAVRSGLHARRASEFGVPQLHENRALRHLVAKWSCHDANVVDCDGSRDGVSKTQARRPENILPVSHSNA
jgi:hypothetical protein